MAVLYVNSRGQAWRKHSFSAGADYDQSALKYFLRRVHGWRPRDDKASFRFGRALEQAIQFRHESGKGGVEEFKRLWLESKDDKTLVFTKTEKDWESLNKSGIEMLRLYEIRLPSLPISANAVFQREYSKEVYPGDESYGEIEFAGKLDIVSYPDPDHPKLAKLEWKPEYGVVRPLIIDIKTTAMDFPETPGIAAFHKQLRAYSWLTGIRDVGLLSFKKAGHTFSKGSSVTLLEDAGQFVAGDEAVVAQIVDDKAYLVRSDYFLEEMDNAQGRKEDGKVDQTKAAKERKTTWLSQNAVLVDTSIITRQRLQFNSGFVTIESAEDAGLIAGRQIVNIVNSWKTKRWPNTFGISYPQDDRRDPYFRAFVLGDTVYKEQFFTQKTEDELDLFSDEELGEQD